MTDRSDSTRYLDFFTRKMVRGWIAHEPEREPVFTPLARPLAGCTVAVLSSAGLRRTGDRPFDQDGERANPWWGDPSYRVLPRGVTEQDVACDHLHIDLRPLQQDLDCVLPLRRLGELAAAGEIGAVADHHYAIMGYLPRARQMLAESVPPIIERLQAEQVDLVLLVPV